MPLHLKRMLLLGQDKVLSELFYDLRGFAPLHLHLKLGLLLARLQLRDGISEMLHQQRLLLCVSTEAVIHLQDQPEHVLDVLANNFQALAHTIAHLVVLSLSLALAPLELCTLLPPRMLL